MSTPGLLALDVDGTLMCPDNTLSSRNARAVALARKLGWRVLLATGKPPWAVAPLCATLRLPGPHVVANGSALWHERTGLEVLARIADGDVRTALGFAATQRIPRALSGPAGVFCEPDWGVDAVEMALAAVNESPPTVLRNATMEEASPWKVILITPTDARRLALPQMATGRWVRTHPLFLEALPRHASKASALSLAAGRLKVGADQVVAFGDGENDIEMLRWAGQGVAMGHAPPAVRAVADRITKANDEDGVAVVLENLLRNGVAPLGTR